MKLAALQSQFSPETRARIQAEYYDALFLLEQTLEDTRTLTFELSPPILYELGLVAALQWLGEQMSRQCGLRITVDGVPPATSAAAAARDAIGEDLRSLLFRSVRELLINVIKHADASAVRISVRDVDRGVRITVADDGSGFNPAVVAKGRAPGGFGLFSMRMRLEDFGGKVEISSIPDAGTRVTLSAPIDT
jgi:signal transduction histidine kinase